jgi:mitochondrial fission protein ELM1
MLGTLALYALAAALTGVSGFVIGKRRGVKVLDTTTPKQLEQRPDRAALIAEANASLDKIEKELPSVSVVEQEQLLQFVVGASNRAIRLLRDHEDRMYQAADMATTNLSAARESFLTTMSERTERGDRQIGQGASSGSPKEEAA